MRRFNFIFFLVFLFVPVVSVAHDCRNDYIATRPDSIIADSLQLAWQERLHRKLDKLCEDELLEVSLAGFIIYDLTDDSVLYKHQERQLMRPASTMKVITAVTALDKLGGGYQFKTRLAYTGTIVGTTLIGNLYCIGGFDPKFSSDDMRFFVQQVKQMGIDSIRGKLVADKSMKDMAPMGEGWCWDDGDNNPLMSPLQMDQRDDVLECFRRELIGIGIYVDAFSETGKTPKNAKSICIRTHTMDEILLRMMKNSDNLYAEAMFYQLGAATGAHPANAKSASGVVKKLINKLGRKTEDYRIADGSGLSLYNYVTPELEVLFLKYAYEHREIYDHLYPSMPIAGEDGTLKKRMQGTPASGNVHAKTGTVSAVSCLAGYCTAANGHTLCFSIMNNGLTSASKGRKFQDRLCIILCEP